LPWTETWPSFSGEISQFAPHAIDPVFAKHGITVLRADEGEGATQLARVLPPHVRTLINSKLLPYTIVILNQSKLGVNEIHHIFWRTSPSTGEKMPIVNSTKVYALPEGAMAPGDWWVEAPFLAMTHTLRDAAKRGLLPEPIEPLAQAQSSVLMFNLDRRRWATAWMEIDAVVLSDGTVLGPDNGGVIRRQKDDVEALRAMLTKLQDASVTPAALNQWLTAEQQRQLGTGPQDANGVGIPGYEAQFMRAQMMKAVQQQIKAKGRGRVTADVAQMLEKETSTLNRLKPVKE
jgi:hypothetical protein